MKSIEQIAMDTFQTNLEYLSKEHENLYQNITLLTTAINQGAYKEKYALEYKTSYFDVLELSSNNYLYSSNSLNYAKELTNNVNYNRTDNVIETFYSQTLTQEKVQVLDNEEKNIGVAPLYTTAALNYYISQELPKSSIMRRINKYIFFGVGLGLHIPLIQKKLDSKILFIVENDIELFRLSLFTTNYAELAKTTALFFSIMENPFDYKKSFELFFEQGYNHNQYLKYTLFSDNYYNKIKLFQEFIVTQSYMGYPYSLKLQNTLKGPEYLIENYPFINLTNFQKNSPFSNKPVLLLAAGPSLETNGNWLQANHEKFFIVSVLAAVRTLNNLNVKPDIVTHIDTTQKCISFLEGIDIDNFFKKTLFLFSSVTHSEVVHKLPKKQIYLYESVTRYKQDFGAFSAPGVGESTYGIILQLGASEIYLLGMDLALEPTTYQTHISTHEHNTTVEQTNESDHGSTLGSTISYIKGNFLNEVPSLAKFKVSINAFNTVNNMYRQTNQTVYNLSNGAFLEGTLPLSISEIDSSISKIHDKSTQIIPFLSSISEIGCNNKDLIFLHEQIKSALKIDNILTNYKKQVTYSSLESYLNEFANLIDSLIDIKNTTDKSDINLIVYAFIRYTVGYIFDFYNTQGLKNKKRHMKKLDAIYVKQLKKILKLYLITMTTYKNFIAENKT